MILAGHSGAYRVMANILQNGNVEVKETILFDALYAETDKFIQWIKADTAHRFINIYTMRTSKSSNSIVCKLHQLMWQSHSNKIIYHCVYLHYAKHCFQGPI